MATPEAEAHLRRLHSLRRQYMSTDRESSKEYLIRHLPQHVSDRSFASNNRRHRDLRRSHAMKKQSRQHNMESKKQQRPQPPPQIQRPKYISYTSSSSSTISSSASIGPPIEFSSNIQRYRAYIEELSNRLGEDNLYAEEDLELDNVTPQFQQNQPQNTHSRSHRGSGHYNGKIKDSMIQEHYHCNQITREETVTESEESSYGDSYGDEEACLQLNPPSSKHQSFYNNLLIPSHVKLNPRANLYLIMLFTSIITISSLVVGNGKSSTEGRSSRERAALFFSSTSLLIATIVSCGFRYAPIRIYITEPYLFYERFLGQAMDSREKAISITLLLVILIVCGIVMKPKANLAVAYSTFRVLNSALFYSTWISVYTCVIIVADLFTLDASRWIVARDCDGDCGVVPSGGYHPTFRTQALKTWSVSLFANFAMSGTLFSMCTAGLHEKYRTKIMVAGFLGVCGGLIGTGVLALYHIVAKAQDRACSYGTWNTIWEGPHSQEYLIRLGTVLAILVMVMNCTIVGLICSPPTGPGSIVLTSWVALIVSILLCKKYIESFFVTQPLYKEGIEMCSDSMQSKGTHTTAHESNSIASGEGGEDVDEYETDGQVHDELMNRLKALSVSVKFEQQEPAEENAVPISRRLAVNPQTQCSHQKPEEKVHSGFAGRSQDVDSPSKTTSQASKSKPDLVEHSPCSVISEKIGNIKTNTVPKPPQHQNSRGNSQKVPPPSPRRPPPPPYQRSKVDPNSEGESPIETDSVDQKGKPRRKPTRPRSRSDGFVRLTGKNSAAIDALVADTLRHAQRVKEMAEGPSEDIDDSFASAGSSRGNVVVDR